MRIATSSTWPIPAAIASVANELVSSHGTPHILINNAGAGRWLPLLQTTADEAAAMMTVPYLAAFNMTRELLAGMLERRSGHIVNVTSVAARLPGPAPLRIQPRAQRWKGSPIRYAPTCADQGSP